MSGSQRPFLYGVLVALGVVLLWMLRDLAMLVAFAVLLAYVLDPAVTALERVRLWRLGRVRRGFAAGFAILALGALLAWVASLAVPRLASEFARFVERVPATARQLVVEARSWAEARGLSAYVDPLVAGADPGALTRGAVGLLAAWAGRLFGGIGQLLGLLVLPLLAFYLLAEREAVQESALRFVPREAHPRLLAATAAVDRALRSYVRGQALVCLVSGTVTGVALQLLGFPLSLLLGVLVGLGEVVPFLGFAIAVTAIALIGYGVSPALAALGVAAYAALNWLVGLLVTPRVMGRHMKMHPFVVTVSVLAGGHLLGPAGALLALPGAAVLQVLMGEFAPRRGEERS